MTTQPTPLASATASTQLYRYRDPVEGFSGYLAFDGSHRRLAVGGCRLQRGLHGDTVIALARAMTLKQRLLGLAVDGAKCGLDFDPCRPGRRDALRRFLRFLAPHLRARYSMGPDMGTSWEELEELAAEQGIGSVKAAVAAAQGLAPEDFRQRLALLGVTVEGATVGERRAGHGLAHAAASALRCRGGDPVEASVAVQGFGTLGRAALRSLAALGLRVTAVADVHACLRNDAGLDVEALLATPSRPGSLAQRSDLGTPGAPAGFGEVPAQVLVLAACADGLNAAQAARLPSAVRVVAVGANLGLADDAETLLAQRDVLVIPDFVGGAGGSASMAALFGPATCPTAPGVLAAVGATMRALVRDILALADEQGTSPRAAALSLARLRTPPGAARPYDVRPAGSVVRLPRSRAGQARPAPCRHERAHIVDSRFHGAGYATPVSRAIFCDTCRLQRWLDVEAALAASQADLGIIPRSAADEIVRRARIEQFDPEQLIAEFGRTNHSLVALLRALEQACAGDAGQYVHFGATTQDIQDTAQALECRAVLDAVDIQLDALLGRLRTLAAEHRDTLMIGRTHARPALPITFGFKVAGWIDELLRHAARLDAVRTRTLVVELFGGVGTMAGFGPAAAQLLHAFAERLGLGAPAIGWHVARDRVSEFVTTLAMFTSTLARIADELRTLGRPEFDELEEGWQQGRVGSSTMPHKRNPERCEQVVVLARLARAAAGLAMDAMVSEHERDSRSLRVEWPAVADVSHAALVACAFIRDVLSDLHVLTDRMAAHAGEEADQLCSEALMLSLGRSMGKQRAYGVVYDLCNSARAQGRTLRDLVRDSADVSRHLDGATLDELFDPARQVGAAGVLVDRVLADLDARTRSARGRQDVILLPAEERT